MLEWNLKKSGYEISPSCKSDCSGNTCESESVKSKYWEMKAYIEIKE